MKRALRWADELVSAAAVLAVCAACSPAASPGAAPASPAPASTALAPTAAAPALGRLAGLFEHGAGFGKVKPTRIFNGGDPTGLVTHITWRSWGQGQAIGTGTSVWVGPHQAVAQGRPAKVTLVAFFLGTCHGKPAYRAVEWYFPEHHQAFNPNRYEDICSGSYVGS